MINNNLNKIKISNAPIELKGSSFTLSVVHLHETKPEVIRQALADKIAQAPSFLKLAPVVVNVSNLLTPVHWEHLQQAVADAGLRIVGISGCKDPKLKAEIERSGLPLLTEGKEKTLYHSSSEEIQQSLHVAQNTIQITKARLIDVPVRSGQCIYAPNCDLIVTNHVSAGAELITNGNIHIYGVLRGRALAGASGNREAQIFCTNLVAELISIAGEYWLSDQIPAEFYGKAARLCLADNGLSIHSLN